MRLFHAATLGLCAACAGCSRGAPAGEGPPLGAATSTSLPAAASGARVDPPAAPSASVAALPGALPVGRPRLRDGGATLSNAGLPAVVVQRIVRQNFGRFRLCYENGLRTDPFLAGTVKVRFVIETDGAVGVVSDAGSDLTDRGVVACVERGFGNLSFPSPASGAVAVVYPIYFSPGEPPTP
ncbi:MAG TPA: AgmX/PglI C-terminal domain-containing protein [Polyangiaceae bacterium]